MEFSRQEYWSGLLLPSPADLPSQGIEPGSPALWADLLSEPPGKNSFKKLPLRIITGLCLFKSCLCFFVSKGAQGFFKIGVIFLRNTYLATGLTRGICHCSAWAF